MRLAGKVIIITGAGSGFGKGIAERFADEGAKLVLADINQQAGDQVANALRAGGAEAIHVYKLTLRMPRQSRALLITPSSSLVI